MNKLIYILFAFSTISFYSQQSNSLQELNTQEIFQLAEKTIIDDENKKIKIEERNKRIEIRNWYSGDGFSPIIGVGDDFLVGSRLHFNNFYIGFKSNFGFWGKDKPSDYDSAFDDLNWILNDMDGYFLDSYTYTSSAVYILNTGYSFSTLKTKDVNLSIFLGPGLAMVNEVKYDRYTEQYLNENYYVTQKQLNTKVNINMGVMMTLKSSIGFILGLDSYNSSFFTGIHLYL